MVAIALLHWEANHGQDQDRDLESRQKEPLQGQEAASNVASLRRKPFRQQGLATACQRCYQATQDSPVYRVGYVSFQGRRFPDCFEVELPNVVVLDLRIESDGWSR